MKVTGCLVIIPICRYDASVFSSVLIHLAPSIGRTETLFGILSQNLALVDEL